MLLIPTHTHINQSSELSAQVTDASVIDANNAIQMPSRRNAAPYTYAPGFGNTAPLATLHHVM